MRTRLLTAAARLARFVRDRRASVTMIFAFALPPICFATGMAIDYGSAMRIQTKLEAAADAAALAAVSKQVINQPNTTAYYAAQQIFGIQSANTNGLTINLNDPSQFSVNVAETNTNGFTRTVTVSFRGQSANLFSTILGISTLTVKGSSVATATIAPNMDFYVLLDTSGSMAFPSTSAGITQLRSLTGGCAFACHSTNDGKARDKNNALTDYYGVATSYGIPLRVDEARKAIQNMMSRLQDMSSQNSANYRAAMATFAAADTRANNSYTLLAPLTTNLQSVSNSAAQAQTSLYYNNGCPKNNYCNNDTDTATTDAFTKLNASMTDPGNGTTASGDKPQATMFVITDGMRDETRSNGRPEIAIEGQPCTTIKARGIRIAILYTEYLQSSMDGDSWSQTNVVPYLGQIEPALKSCASDGLYYKVSSDDDISAALNQLLQNAVATARLTK